MNLRDEVIGDEEEIHALTRLAFEGHPMSNGNEPYIIDALRRDGDLTLSVVAFEKGGIVGHIAFSPVQLSGTSGQWFGLGPVSVRPDLQSTGIGTRLIEEGLERLRSSGATGCVLLGDPAYYNRFGFRSQDGLTYGDAPTRYVQSLSFGEEQAQGDIQYSPAFEE